MSSALQTVIPGPNLVDFGNRPDLTPAHQVDFPTGMIGRMGGEALGLPIMW